MSGERTSKMGRRVTGWGLLLAGAGGNRTVRLQREGTYVVGRSRGCDLMLDDAGVSRKHLELRVTPEGVELVDLGSSNGTFLGDRRLGAGERLPLKAGETCRVGNSMLLLFENREYESDPPKRQLDEDEQPVLASPAMQRIFGTLEQLARGELSVLLLGETGVGKEVLARLVHSKSPRVVGPFVAVNCAALPEQLMESELFGHEKGAFTNADRPRQGRLEAGNGGTVLLDEVGDLPLPLQAKLLRVLEDKMVQPVGGTPRPLDVRFLAATNRDLGRAAQSGEFRRDLYYRLAGAVLRVPPLRERPEDIEPLAKRFAADGSRTVGATEPVELSAAALTRMRAYSWPGNVRELRNVIERALLVRKTEIIGPDDLQLEEHYSATDTGQYPVSDVASTDKLPPTSDEPSRRNRATRRPEDEEPQLKGALRDLEKELIVSALEACGGNQTRAAGMLGISRRALVKKLGIHQVARPRKNSPT